MNALSSSDIENKWLKNKGLHFCHLNIHYLYPKLDEIKTLLHNQTNIDILCLCETFLHDKFSDDELKIDGYNFVRKDRQRHGGGLIIYIKSNLSFLHRTDLETNNLETIWIELKNSKQKSFLIGYYYRQPSSTIDWITKIENNIERAVSSNQREVILLGDFNINLLHDNSSTRSWIRTINSLNFQQLINNPTRITAVSETLIDHMYSNVPENITETKVPHFAVSDHYPICFTRKTNSSYPSGPVHKSINYRDTKYFDETSFLQDLDNLPWFMVYESDNANSALDIFVSLFHSVLNKHAPQKSRRVKHAVQPNWMNSEILEAMKTRDKYHTEKKTEQYRIWRNKVKSLIQHAKTEFYSVTINNNHKNPRQLWQNLHDVTGKSNKYQTALIKDEFGNVISSPEIAANTFNKFFTSVFEQFQSSDKQYDSRKLDKKIKNTIPDDIQFSITSVSIGFIKSQLENLKTNKATGIDDISAKFLKLSAPIICKPLAIILNFSIQQGIYPDNLKKAKVTPIFKKGDRADPNNYRPISVLPIISSIFERHISNCITTFVDKYNLIYHNQSGFRKQHSCQTALTKLTDTWLAAINENEIVGSVLLDLTKAFDLVNHNILLRKLASYKFSPTTLVWFDSYLSNRKQQVHVSGKLSCEREIKAGVPQGSVLGPLLFILYINDLSLHIDFCDLDLFADDSTMSTSNPSISVLVNLIQADLLNFDEWCQKNDMTLNIAKTKAMVISTKQTISKIMSNPPDIKLNENLIQISNQEKLLGINIDSELSWSSQVDNTLKKCNTLLYLLSRIKQYLSIPVRKLFYNAYILPHLDYCCTIWGNSTADSINSVIKFQKRAARLILDKDFDTPSVDLFAELNWMTFPERVQFQKAIMMFKTMNNLAPTYMNNLFQYTNEIHNRNLRSTTENLLYVPKPKCEIFRNSFAYSGAKLWNSIPQNIKSCNSVQQFKDRYLEWMRIM